MSSLALPSQRKANSSIGAPMTTSPTTQMTPTGSSPKGRRGRRSTSTAPAARARTITSGTAESEAGTPSWLRTKAGSMTRQAPRAGAVRAMRGELVSAPRAASSASPNSHQARNSAAVNRRASAQDDSGRGAAAERAKATLRGRLPGSAHVDLALHGGPDAGVVEPSQSVLVGGHREAVAPRFSRRQQGDPCGDRLAGRDRAGQPERRCRQRVETHLLRAQPARRDRPALPEPDGVGAG